MIHERFNPPSDDTEAVMEALVVAGVEMLFQPDLLIEVDAMAVA
jgi:hypothetical protein